jgi:hypothetical protein
MAADPILKITDQFCSHGAISVGPRITSGSGNRISVQLIGLFSTPFVSPMARIIAK